MNTYPVPLLHSVDVVVFGDTAAAVAAATAAHDAGASVVVLSDRSSFGSDIAGTLAFLDPGEPDSAFLRPIWEAGRRGGHTRPGAVRHALEKQLLSRQIPFLFLSRPVALLPGESGRTAGLLYAARTALYALEAKSFIDASTSGLLAGLTGAAPRLAPAHSLTVLSKEATLAGATALNVPIEYTDRKGDVFAHRYLKETPAPCPPTLGAAAAFEGNYRAQIVEGSIIYLAESLKGEGLSGAPSVTPLQPNLFLLHLDGYPVEATTALALQEGANIARLAAGIAPDALPSSTNTTPGAFGFVASFHRGAVRTLQLELPTFPSLGKVDVAVAGGGTGGAPAGIAAARAGASTVILEAQRALGGVGTLGTIACYYFGNQIGFTDEIDEALKQIDPTHAGTGKRAIWNPELKASWYLRTLVEAGGQAWLGSFAFGVRKNGRRADALLVSTPWGAGLLEAGTIVDASGSADIAAAAGAPCRAIDARHVAVQGAGLSPRRPHNPYINSDFTFVDDDDAASITHAFVQARARFSEDFDTIPFINTRERRQIRGEIELSPLDFLAKRNFPDTITLARSNFDTHGYTVHPVFMVTPPDHKCLNANVPYRVLIPQELDGVLVTGLGMSAHRDALPVIRMQADVQNQGYAAGYAAHLSTKEKCDVRDIPFAQLQSHLIEIGTLTPDAPEWVDRFPLPASEIEAAARVTPIDFYHASILFAHPEESIVALRHVLKNAFEPVQIEEVALLLGLLRAPEAAEHLAQIIESYNWDEGWNFRGMGQFGMSCSRVDALIIALARTGSPLAIEPILDKIKQLKDNDAFSHVRAVAVAAIELNDPTLTAALAELLKFPTFRGHAQVDTLTTITNEPPPAPGHLEQDWERDRFLRCENSPRSDSLREIYLGKALYLCNDPAGLGETILKEYSRDLRGIFARHAQAVLAETDIEKLRRETI